MKFVFSTVLVISVLSEAENTKCGDWKPFKEEKCFKIFDDACLKNYEDAVKTCQSNESILITIHFQEEQDFIEKYLKDKKIVDNVWIGIKYENKTYKWTDNTDVVYKNWAQNSAKNKSDHCTEIESDDGLVYGEWVDVLCTKKNIVVCQKPQTWSLSHLQKLLLDNIKNPVPIGFTYVQHPKEKSPTEIWPWMIWKDVSSDYAGMFFRAAGSQALDFGKVQEENAQRIKEVNIFKEDENDPGWNEVYKHRSPDWSNAPVPVGARSNWVFVGGEDGIHRHLSFVTNGGENRPRNMAIKIWRRMG